MNILKANHKVSIYQVDYIKASWKYVIISIFAYGLGPVVLPIMILASKLLKRKVKFFPVYPDAT